MKVMIAEDQQLIRESLKIILDTQKDYEVVASVENGEQVLKELEKQCVDIILMDIRMPVMDGVECTKRVKELFPAVQVLILTTFAEDELITQALSNGASGYLLKGASLMELQQAIQTVYEGGSILDPEVASRMVNIIQKKAQNNARLVSELCSEVTTDVLTSREWDIIQLISDGLSNKEIAMKLIFTEGTIRNNISVILEKLHLRDRTQLAIWYLHNGKQFRPEE